MSNKFQPQAGMYFYAGVKPRTRLVDDDMGNVTQVVQQDCSYRGYIFYCIATDDHAVVCECVFGGSNYSPRVFVRDTFDFTPIGPDVMSKLRLHFDHKYSISL
jgi:hypothetical protein